MRVRAMAKCNLCGRKVLMVESDDKTKTVRAYQPNMVADALIPTISVTPIGKVDLDWVAKHAAWVTGPTMVPHELCCIGRTPQEGPERGFPPILHGIPDDVVPEATKEPEAAVTGGESDATN